MEAVNVVTAGLVEDQPSPMHTKEFQTLSEFQSVNLDHETGNLFRGIVNSFINIYFFFQLEKKYKNVRHRYMDSFKDLPVAFGPPSKVFSFHSENIFFGKIIYKKKLQLRTILFSHKLCVTEMGRYVNKLIFFNGFVDSTP